MSFVEYLDAQSRSDWLESADDDSKRRGWRQWWLIIWKSMKMTKEEASSSFFYTLSDDCLDVVVVLSGVNVLDTSHSPLCEWFLQQHFLLNHHLQNLQYRIFSLVCWSILLFISLCITPFLSFQEICCCHLIICFLLLFSWQSYLSLHDSLYPKRNWGESTACVVEGLPSSLLLPSSSSLSFLLSSREPSSNLTPTRICQRSESGKWMMQESLEIHCKDCKQRVGMKQGKGPSLKRIKRKRNHEVNSQSVSYVCSPFGSKDKQRLKK